MKKIIIIGAGFSGQKLFQSMKKTEKEQVTAFIDDNSKKKTLLGKKILSRASAIELLAADVKYKVYLAIPSLTKEEIGIIVSSEI